MAGWKGTSSRKGMLGAELEDFAHRQKLTFYLVGI